MAICLVVGPIEPATNRGWSGVRSLNSSAAWRAQRDGGRVDLADQLARQVELLHADGAGAERVRLDDVGPGGQILAVDLGDRVRVRQAEDVGEAVEVLVVPAEALAADLLLGQPERWISVPIAPSRIRIRSASKAWRRSKFAVRRRGMSARVAKGESVTILSIPICRNRQIQPRGQGDSRNLGNQQRENSQKQVRCAGKDCLVLKIITTPTDIGGAAWAAHGPCAPGANSRERMPEMTATFTAERRRTAPTPPRPLRELPVLFHLMDVSRPKGYAAPPTPAFTLGSLADEPELPASAAPRHRHGSSLPSKLASELVSEPPLDSAQLFDLETAAELVQTRAYGSLPMESPVSEAALTAPIEASPNSSEPNDNSSADSPASAASLETPAPAGDDAVTLRQRAEERQRKRREWLKDDWFSSQGRFIAIGFVIALVVTIYVARSGRKPAAPPVAAKSHAHPGEAATAKARTAKNSSVKQAAAAESAKITSVRPTKKPDAASEPKTALHPPTIPQLASQPAAANAPADATLFTFSKRNEERVATRTDTPAGPTTNSAAPSPTATTVPNSPLPSTRLPSAHTSGAAPPPPMQPQYPATNYPSTYQPVAPPPAYAPPPGAYASPPGAYAPPAGAYASPPATYAPPAGAYASPPGAYAPPPGVYAPPPGTYAPTSAPPGPALNPAASTAPLYPTTNTASGYRYERTGSSVY